ncbi:MAG: hypothetical protein IH846_14975 [Acidobacteria bacterium]|nr:hypothetical protein [Acidobacteriota bacterium]
MLYDVLKQEVARTHNTANNRLDSYGGAVGEAESQTEAIGAMALILVAYVLLMGQASPNRTVKANGFFLIDENGKTQAALDLGPNGAESFGVWDANGDMRTRLSERSLILVDAEGFHVVVGATGLITPRTGKTRKTSAASVVLFDKDKKVLWSAP